VVVVTAALVGSARSTAAAFGHHDLAVVAVTESLFGLALPAIVTAARPAAAAAVAALEPGPA
jgi:hypothetical protein